MVTPFDAFRTETERRRLAEADAQIGHGSVIETDSHVRFNLWVRRHLSEGQRYGSRLSAAAVSAAKAQSVSTPPMRLDLHWPGRDRRQRTLDHRAPNDFRCVVKGSSRVVDPGGNRVTDVCGQRVHNKRLRPR